MSAPLYLAIDQGGQSSRALVFDGRGEVVARGSRLVATVSPSPDRVEQDPTELIASVRDAIDEALAALGTDGARAIVAAGIATQRSSLVAWDRATGRALTPILSWQDRRAAAWLEQHHSAADEVRKITGLRLSPHYGVSKMRWCLDEVPAVCAALDAGTLALAPLATFLLWHLAAGHPYVVDPSNGSRTLLWNRKHGDWSKRLLARFGIPREILPETTPTVHDFGTLDRVGHKIPIRVLDGDQAAALFAYGEPDTDATYVNIGTGAFLQWLRESGYHVPDELLTSVVLHEPERKLDVVEGTVHGAGAALAWFAREPGIDDLDARLPAWLADATVVPPVFLNGIGGVGSPYWLPSFESEFADLPPGRPITREGGVATQAARAIAVVESIAFLIVANAELMGGLRLRGAWRFARIIATGGLSRLDALCQRIADLTGIPVERPGDVEATARGVAWLLSPRDDWSAPAARDRFSPATNPGLVARYRRWRALMDEATRNTGA